SYFFFQAEDGIRDDLVTGVQTCALPICRWYKTCSCDPGCPCDFNQRPTQGHCHALVAMRVDKGNFGDVDLGGVTWGGLAKWPGQIGRASCREGVEKRAGARCVHRCCEDR